MKTEPVVVINAVLVGIAGVLQALGVIDVETSDALIGAVLIIAETFLVRGQVSPA
jgi:hypothetical protein